MSASANEKLTIEIQVVDNKAKAKLDEVSRSVERLANASGSSNLAKFKDISTNIKGLAGISKSVSKTADGVGQLANALSGFKGKDLNGSAKNLGKLLTTLSKGVGKVDDKAFNSIGKFATGIRTLSDLAAKGNLAANLNRVATSVAGFTQNLMNAIPEGVLNRFERLGNAMANMRAGMSLGSASKAASGGLSKSKALSFISNTAKALGHNLKLAAKYGTALAKVPFSMMFSPLKGVASVVKSIHNSFSGLMSKIGRIALMRAIRGAIRMVTTAIKEGVNNLYIWASMVGNSFKPTMDSLASSFLYLKNSIGAAVSPLLDYFAPVLESVINQVVEFVNVINQAIASLTGASSWRKAIRSAADYSDNISGLGHDAEDANDAVKELKRTILGFDEINRLEDKTKTLSPKSAGKDATGYYANDGAFSFVEMQISKPVENFVKKLEEAWDNSDFTEIGNTIGEKLGGAMMNVPWTSIQDGAIQLTSSVGTLINGMFSYDGSGGKAMWDGIAYTVYNGINTAIMGYTNFFNTVEWEGIGKGVGAAARDALKNINWSDGDYSVAAALAAFPNAVILAVKGICEEFKPQDFYEIGADIGDAVAKAIIRIHWKDFFLDVTGMGVRLLSALNGALEGFGANWGGIREGILGGIKAVPTTRWESLGNLLGRAIFNVAGFALNIIDTLIDALKAVEWGTIIRGIWDGIDQKVKEKYGSWGEAAKSLAGWIGDNIGILTIAFEFALGATALKFGADLLKARILGAALGIGGAGGALSLGSFLSAIPVLASLAIALATVTHISLNDGKIGFMDALGFGIAGALIGFKYAGIEGAGIGFTIGVALTLLVKTLTTDWSEVGGIGSQFNFNGSSDNGSFAGTGWLDVVDDNNPRGGGGSLGNTYYQNRTYGASNGVTQWSETVTKSPTFKVDVDTSNSADWWKQVQTAWSSAISNHKAARFQVTGVINDSEEWWRQAREFWSNKVSTGATKAARFHVTGVVNEATKWWDQLASFWSNGIASRSASRFNVAGVVNGASEWWNQTDKFWSNYTRGSMLYAAVGVEISNTAINNAWYAMQRWFDRNPLTVTVNTSSSGSVYTANGGIYKNGYWQDVTKFATGGMPQTGQAFIAREAGPELVGTLNGSTAVLNNSEIVNSVANGVARAVAAVMGGGAQSPTIEVTVKADSEVLYRTVKKGEKKSSNRYGTAVAIG